MLRSVELVFIVITFIALLSKSNCQNHNGDQKARLKEREDIRHAKAIEVLKYMNVTADPCRDFYDFACGNWAKHQKFTKDEKIITPQNQLELRISKDLQNLLDGSRTRSKHFHKVHNFYKSCLAVKTPSHEQRDFLLNFVKNHGGLKSLPITNWNENYNWENIIGVLRSQYGMEILIGLELDTNVQGRREYAIILGEPKNTIIPAEYCNARISQQTTIRDQIYKDLENEISENMKSWFSWNDPEANRFAGDIVRFEFDLCKNMYKEPSIQTDGEGADVRDEDDEQRKPNYRTGQSRLHGNRHTLPYPYKSLHQWSNQFHIKLKEFVDIAMETPVNDRVYVRSATYFHHLIQLIQMGSKVTVSNYIMYRALSAINFPQDDNAAKHPKYCLDIILRYFPKILGDIYNREVFKSHIKTDVVDFMYRNIYKSLDSSVEEVDWMDSNMKNAIKQKNAQFEIKFPLYINLDISDLVIERLNYWQQLIAIMTYTAKQNLNRNAEDDVKSDTDTIESPAVEMKLIPNENVILTGWGLMHPPLYNYHYPRSLKFSLLGQYMARELVKAFDEQGWNENPMNPIRWNDELTEAFHNQTECFREQISNYLYNNPETFQNDTKIREIITESSGLNIAFKAYLDWLLEMNERVVLAKETLPEVNFTNTQLFFINFAQTRCIAKSDEKPTPDFLPLDKHTIERYNVNGPLANNIEFAREFNCAVGTNMNPVDKCVIY